MTLDEKIHQYVQKLPRSLQEELLDYVEFLATKAEKQEQQEWQSFSLSSAMSDMENESVSYSLTDVRESFE
jgi:hypothetical protein